MERRTQVGSRQFSRESSATQSLGRSSLVVGQVRRVVGLQCLMKFALEFVATLCTAVFAGASLYITLVEHPARMECGTAVAATQFRPSYRRATVMQACLAICAFLAAVSAWWMNRTPIWLLGGILIGAVVPFTLIVILPTNKKLLSAGLEKDSDLARRLLSKWGRLHAVRTVLSLAALVILLVATAAMGQERELQIKEAQLRADLFTLRDEIQQYTLDKQRAPQTLDDLKQSGYVREIPTDPFTGKTDWMIDMEDALMAVDQQEPGIRDVHSSSNLIAADETAYSGW
jgi:competence protein ComGC